jgi:hypothetical protein
MFQTTNQRSIANVFGFCRKLRTGPKDCESPPIEKVVVFLKKKSMIFFGHTQICKKLPTWEKKTFLLLMV